MIYFYSRHESCREVNVALLLFLDFHILCTAMDNESRADVEPSQRSKKLNVAIATESVECAAVDRFVEACDPAEDPAPSFAKKVLLGFPEIECDSGTESDEELERIETNSIASLAVSQTSDYYASQPSWSVSSCLSRIDSPLCFTLSDQDLNCWENLSISTSPSQNLEDARESSSASNCAVGQSDPQLPTHHYHTRQQLQRLKREILNNEMPTKSSYGADEVDSNDGEVDLYQRTAFVPFKKCRGLLEPLQSGLRSNGSKTATMNNTLSSKSDILESVTAAAMRRTAPIKLIIPPPLKLESAESRQHHSFDETVGSLSTNGCRKRVRSDEGDQPQTSTGYFRARPCLNFEKMREKMVKPNRKKPSIATGAEGAAKAKMKLRLLEEFDLNKLDFGSIDDEQLGLFLCWENLSISTSTSQNLEDARESSSASNCAVGQSDPQLPTHHYHTRQQLQRLKREILNNHMPTKSCYGADEVDSNDGEVDLYQRTAFVPFKKCHGRLEQQQTSDHSKHTEMKLIILPPFKLETDKSRQQHNEGNQPQTSTGYLRIGSCLNFEMRVVILKQLALEESAIQYFVTISFMSGVSDDVDDEFWNDSNVSSFCFDDFPSDTAKIIEEIGAELNKLDLNSTDDEELGLFGGDHLTSSFNDEMSSVSNSQTPSDLRSISSETTEQRTTPLSVQATQPGSDDYKRLQAECSRLRSKWTELQCRLKQEKYFAPDFEETIGRLATGEIYIFQYYRRLSDKKQLLKTAIDFGDGDAICCVVLFLERTLSPVVFRQLLLEFPPAVSHYIFYLKQLSTNDKLSELLLSLGLVEQLAAVEVSRICSEKNAESKIALLRKALAGGVFADPSLNEERMFLNSYADLLEHQLPIDAADNSARVEGGLKNENSVVDSSVLETLMYCCRLHYELPSNSLASPLSIRNKFGLTEQQFDWIAIKALAERQQWAEIQKLLLRKGLFGKQKLKLPISCEQLLNVLYSNGATASVSRRRMLMLILKVSVQDITIYIDLFSDNQRKLMLAKKYKCHALVIKILIGLKDRLELLKYMATLSPSSVELSTAETALTNSNSHTLLNCRMAFADNNQLLSALGLSGEKIKETLRNETLTASLSNMANQALKITNGKLSESQGKLLYQTATRLKKQCFQYAGLLIEEICNNRLENDLQLSAALQFLLSHAASDFDKAEFEQACGIGVKVTEEQIEDTVASVIKANEEKLQLMRYKFPISSLIAEVRKVLPWADGSKLKKEIDMQMLILLGPKTLDDMQSGKKIPSKVMPKEKLKAKEIAKNEESEFEGAATIEELMKTKAHFHKPGENYKTEGYVVTPKTMDLLKRHLEITGGKVVTRFPPEPNGILHIGHAKAINIDFGYAKAHGGICYLRYDDTNPEKEEERYFTAIREMVEWLGYTPYKVTHSSDYFDQLYEYALELIRRGHAYVCHQKAEEVKGINPTPSPWRDRPIDESLKLFEDMKNGMFDEGAATLRMKITLEEGKVDPVAYRIKYVPHHRTGNKWCIYPTYDYTHCLCDSIENITHSLCTKEFQSRRSSYYWLCNALDLYCPVQWEFARLNVHYAVISKRKIIKLVQENIIRDWDDPRLFTLTALKRRGFPPQAINNFVAKMGLTTALTAVDPMMLEACVRDVLNVTAPRHMAVLNPLKVRFANPVELPKMVEVPDFPNTLSDKSTGKHHVQFDSTIFIEADDFKEHADDKHFKRFTSTQAVGLKYVGLVMILQEIKKNHLGEFMELIVKVEKLTEQNKPKCFIHWVAKPISCEVRLYERLFHHRNPEDSNEVPGGFLTDVNKDSLHVINDAYIDESLRRCAKVESRFQFERVGFFVVDPDSTDTKLVFNRTVSLKEDVRKT
ncbi:putative glutamine--tRNA ligase [Trichinella murrelli]|uniref:Probable glutamine--tRNA ligase n=2 Tax=Trichinella TaxID=6333 RepID=A0A0V0UEJ4_9BILA|nr:putative glutamine--tRNA ligase [Trichinella murrelli]